jgi:hypothetical protein
VVNDRAAVVARAILALLTASEFRQQLEELLRDEFADERRQAIADRSEDDA